jgi:hypothetical protein
MNKITPLAAGGGASAKHEVFAEVRRTNRRLQHTNALRNFMASYLLAVVGFIGASSHELLAR